MDGAPFLSPPDVAAMGNAKHERGALLQLVFDCEFTLRLQQLARVQKYNLPMLMLTVYIAVMSEWCNGRDVLIGIVSNARYRFELHPMIGFLASQLYLRVKIDEGSSFLDFLHQVESEFYSAVDHGSSGHVAELVSDQELTGVWFNYLDWSAFREGPVQIHGGSGIDDRLQIELLPIRMPYAVGFAPMFHEMAGSVCLDVHYLPELCPQRVVERFFAKLKLSAEAFLRDPLSRVCSCD